MKISWEQFGRLTNEHLPFTCQPEPDESFHGYILRETENCCYESIRYIYDTAGLTKSKTEQLRFPMVFDENISVNRLAKLSRADRAEISKMLCPPVLGEKSANYFYGHPIPRYTIRPSKTKVCPECLLEKSYIRNAWHLLPVTCCPMHGRVLVDRCQWCDNEISPYRNIVSVCRCGFDYRDSTADLVEPSEILLSRHIYKRLGLLDIENDPIENTPFGKLSTYRLFELLVLFTSQFGECKTDTTGKFLGAKHSNAQIHDFLTKISATFINWPDSFKDFFQIVKAHESRNFYNFYSGIRTDCGTFFDAIFLKLLSPEYNFFRIVFEKYLNDEWKNGYIRMIKKADIDSRNKAFLSFSETKDYLGISGTWLKKLLSHGKLNAHTAYRGKSRLVLFSLKSVKALKAKYDALLAFDQALRLLGINKKAMMLLIENEAIIPVRGPTVDGYTRWLFDADSLKCLIDVFEKKLINSKIKKRCRGMLYLAQGAKFLSPVKVSISDLILYVLKGVIVPFGRRKAGGLGGFFFKEKDLIKILTKKLQSQKTDRLFIRDVSKNLNIHYEAASHLVKNGLLPPIKNGIQNATRGAIWREAIAAFHEKYILANEIAKRNNTSCKFVFNYLKDQNVIPVTGPTVDGGRQYVYLKEDLIKVELEIPRTIPRSIKTKSPRRLDTRKAAEFLGISMANLRKLVHQRKIACQGAPYQGARQKGEHFKFSLFELQRYKKRCVENSDIISASEAARVLEVDLSWFYKKYIKTGYLKTIDFEDKLGKYFFERKDIERLKKLKNETVSGPKAAKIIGVQRNAVIKLKNKGILNPVSGPGIDGFGCYLYPLSDVTGLKRVREKAKN